jgi:hypothetical protein
MLTENLGQMHAALVGLEVHARKLQNQNFADIAKSASGKVFQLLGHPDFAAVQDLHDDEKGSTNVVAFQAELTALENSGDGKSPRAEELRALIKQGSTPATIELAVLEKSGQGQSPRARDLRIQIAQSRAVPPGKGYMDAERAELAKLESTGQGQSPRATELRGLIARGAVVGTTRAQPFPGEAADTAASRPSDQNYGR